MGNYTLAYDIQPKVDVVTKLTFLFAALPVWRKTIDNTNLKQRMIAPTHLTIVSSPLRSDPKANFGSVMIL